MLLCREPVADLRCSIAVAGITGLGASKAIKLQLGPVR